MSFVLDSSITLSWYFQDQSTPVTLGLLNEVAARGAVAPALWRLEVANGFQSALRRGKVDEAYRNVSLKDLSRLPVAIDQETDLHLWTRTVVLSDRFRLTIYDAVFLELAQRRKLPLASLDQALRSAGHSLGILLLGK